LAMGVMVSHDYMITPLQADRGGFRRGRTDCWFSRWR
jgi:hypothetical protein